MENLRLRPANVDDELFLQELFYNVRSVDFIRAGVSETQLKPLLAMQYNAQKQSYDLHFPNAEHSIIEFENTKIGRILINREAQKVHLVDISLLHNFCGKGFGSFLLENLKAEAEILSLSVFKTNFGAIRLYEKLGLKVTDDDGIYLKMEWKNVG